MQILIHLIEKEGKLFTQVIEFEGAMKAVRNYATPEEAIVYLNKQALMYAQPPLEPAQLPGGRVEVNEFDEEVLIFGNIQSAIAKLNAFSPAKPKAEAKSKKPAKKAPAKKKKKKSA